MNNELMEQCRKEAEEVYPEPLIEHYQTLEGWQRANLEWSGFVKGYARGLYAERSKRRELTDEEIEHAAYDSMTGVVDGRRIYYHDPGSHAWEAFKDGIRYARDNYLSTWLTVEMAMEVMARYFFEVHQTNIGHRGSKAYDNLRARLTEAAKH